MPSFFSIICNAIQKVFNFLLFNHSQTSVLKLLPVQNIKSTHKNTALISRLTGHHSNCESALFPIIVREKKMKMSQSALASRCRAAYTRWHINKNPPNRAPLPTDYENIIPLIFALPRTMGRHERKETIISMGISNKFLWYNEHQ